MMVLTMFALATGLAACGMGTPSPHRNTPAARPNPPTASPTARPRLPLATGPVLSFTGDFPYTVQGVWVTTEPTAYGTPAPAGWEWLTVTIEVKGTLTDRPTPAPSPELAVTWPACDRPLDEVPTECIAAANFERDVRYMTRQEAETIEEAQEPDPSETLAAGTAYLTIISTKVPQSVSLAQIKMCTIPPVGQEQARRCIPLRLLPHSTG